MREKNFRTRSTTSTLTLVTAALLVLLVGGGSALSGPGSWWSLLLTFVEGYLLLELNNRHALLRVRSRMVCATFLGLSLATPWLLGDEVSSLLPAAGLVAAFFPLFAAYQSPAAAGSVFYASLFISLGSLVYPPLLLLLLPLLLALALHLRALSGRTFPALLFGAAVPYWFLAGIAIWEGRGPEMLRPFVDAFHFAAPDYAALTPMQRLLGIGLNVVGWISVVHYRRTYYNDKIRTRMYFYTLILFEIFLIMGVDAQPQHADVLLPLLTATTAPLLAHHVTLARGRSADIWYVVVLAAWVGAVVANLYYAYASAH